MKNLISQTKLLFPLNINGKQYCIKFKVLLLHAFLFFILLLSNSVYSQEKNYYYYNGEKFYIDIDYSTISITFEGEKPNILNSSYKIKYETPDYTRSSVIPADKEAMQRQSIKTTTNEVELSLKMLPAEYSGLIREFQKEDNVVKVSPAYIYNGKKMGLSNNFYVKLRSSDDLGKLYDMAKQYSIEVLGHNQYMPLWFTLSCTKNTPYNAIETANIFYESHLFESAEPEFLLHDLLATNDPYFSYQWGLKNTDQYCNTSGIDIKAEQAWGITTGSTNIKTAIFD